MIKHIRNTINIKIRNLVIITYISFIAINDTIQKFQSFNRQCKNNYIFSFKSFNKRAFDLKIIFFYIVVNACVCACV